MKNPTDLLRDRAKKYCKRKYGNATVLAKVVGYSCAAMSYFLHGKISIEYQRGVKLKQFLDGLEALENEESYT
jgi:hypothetical protein